MAATRWTRSRCVAGAGLSTAVGEEQQLLAFLLMATHSSWTKARSGSLGASSARPHPWPENCHFRISSHPPTPTLRDLTNSKVASRSLQPHPWDSPALLESLLRRAQGCQKHLPFVLAVPDSRPQPPVRAVPWGAYRCKPPLCPLSGELYVDPPPLGGAFLKDLGASALKWNHQEGWAPCPLLCGRVEAWLPTYQLAGTGLPPPTLHPLCVVPPCLALLKLPTHSLIPPSEPRHLLKLDAALPQCLQTKSRVQCSSQHPAVFIFGTTSDLIDYFIMAVCCPKVRLCVRSCRGTCESGRHCVFRAGHCVHACLQPTKRKIWEHKPGPSDSRNPRVLSQDQGSACEEATSIRCAISGTKHFTNKTPAALWQKV